jgi:hypothetical protein
MPGDDLDDAEIADAESAVADLDDDESLEEKADA